MVIHLCIFFLFLQATLYISIQFFFSAALLGLWDLSSLTRD